MPYGISSAPDLFGGSFLHKKTGAEVSARKQKKMRKWMVRHYKERINAFPEEIRSHFAPEKSDAEVFDFLEACLELQQALVMVELP